MASLYRLISLLMLLALAACTAQPVAQPATEVPTTGALVATEAPVLPTLPPTISPTLAPTNSTTACVTDYDPTRDYFPQKITLTQATGFRVEYFNHYKVVTVNAPWPGADQPIRYVLLQCGTPAPSDPTLADVPIIEVPIKSIVTMSTTELVPLMQVKSLDRLVGVSSFNSISSPEVRELINANKLVEVGNGSEVNVEVLINLQPDVVMTSATGNADHDAHPKLNEAGIDVVFDSAWLETTPLGRAEWIKYMGLFFNQEAAAETSFAEMAERYTTMAAKARAVAEKPTVLVGFTYDGTWYVSGGKGYAAQMLADAGANYLWADDDAVGSLQLSFETVFDRAQDADFWVNASAYWFSLADVREEDERYTQFAAFQNATIYNYTARVNESGGNDYWESGVAHPDIVLADLIKIFHPDLLPDHELYYYQHLDP